MFLDEWLAADEGEAARECSRTVERVASLCRRSRRALYDLGLLAIVRQSPAGQDWLIEGTGSVVFRPLTVAQAERFVRALEDLAAGREPRLVDHDPAQLVLCDLGGPVPGPSAGPTSRPRQLRLLDGGDGGR